VRLVACSDRQMRPCVTCEGTLSAGKYLLLPISLRPRPADQPLSYVVRVGSAKPLLCEPTFVADAQVSAALAAYVKSGGKPHSPFEAMVLYTKHDGAGWLSYAENRSTLGAFTVELNQEGSFNVLPSRGSLASFDILRPQRGQLLQVLTRGFDDDGYSMSSSMQFHMSALSLGDESHSPSIEGGVHAPMALSGGAAPSGREQGIHDMLQRLGFSFLQ